MMMRRKRREAWKFEPLPVIASWRKEEGKMNDHSQWVGLWVGVNCAWGWSLLVVQVL